MPVYKYLCPVCKKADKRLLSVADAQRPQSCRTTSGCPGVLVRNVQVPTMVAKEVVDNGIMARRVERDVDGEALAAERARKNYRQPD